MYFLIERPLLLAVQNHQIESVLERLPGRPDRLFLVHFLAEITSAGIVFSPGVKSPVRVDWALL